jgi:uncharacterized protein YueI
MDDQTEKRSYSGFAGKSELERTIQAGIQGAPNLRGEEKAQYLGEYRERVLRVLTRSQVWEKVVYPEIEEALKDPRAAMLVVHGDIKPQVVEKYRKLAQARGKPVTSRADSDYSGETGLVVAARDAVDADEILVENRRDRLMRKGLPEQLVEAVGQAVCKDCNARIRETAPEELKNYRYINAFSRLMGEKCPGHE